MSHQPKPLLIEHAVVQAEISLRLDEEQIRALALLSEYGPERVVDKLAEISTSFDRGGNHAIALTRLLSSVLTEFHPVLAKIDAARKCFKSPSPTAEPTP